MISPWEHSVKQKELVQYAKLKLSLDCVSQNNEKWDEKAKKIILWHFATAYEMRGSQIKEKMRKQLVESVN